jgi:hypothetical protein
LQRIEQETVVVWNEADEEAILTTHSDRWRRKLEKMGLMLDLSIPGLIRFKFPKEFVRIRRKRVVSDAQRKLAAETMRRTRETQRKRGTV